MGVRSSMLSSGFAAAGHRNDVPCERPLKGNELEPKRSSIYDMCVYLYIICSYSHV